MTDHTTTPVQPVRVVLEGVPYIGSRALPGGSHEGVFFPAAMRALTEYLGESPTYDYTFHMGTSGAAFGLLWHTQRWHYSHDLSDLAVSCGWPEPIGRAFAAVGYECEVIARDGTPANAALFRRGVVESVRDRGRPVLASGVVGPPCCSLITGYDEGGDVVTGWSYFQGMPGHGPAAEFEPCGYFRKRDWYDSTWTLILVGKKGERPPLSQVYREALRWAVEVARTPVRLDRHSGLAAYTAWADDLRRDEDLPQDDVPVLLERLDCHMGAASVATEGRTVAVPFLRRAAEQLPAMAGALLEAAGHYDAVSKKTICVFELQGGYDSHDEKVARRLAEPDVRRQISALILQARDEEEQAVTLLERALSK